MKFSNDPSKEHGILIAADEKAEWLLPWWWSRYSTQCQLPLAVVDFGMSHFGKTFCDERALLLPLELEKRLPPLPSHVDRLEAVFGKELRKKRKSWFKKPFALLSSPFKRTLWLDLDCEILKPLDSLFELPGRLYLAEETEASHQREKELGTIFEDECLYNSGVILYFQREPIIEKWAEAVIAQGDQFWSDQHTLSRLLHTENFPVDVLDENYNWRMSQGLNIHAVIVHWVASWGKEYIRRYNGIADALATLPPI